MHEADVIVQKEKERADASLEKGKQVKVIARVSRRIRKVDADLKALDLNLDQKQEAALNQYRIRMLDAKLTPVLQGQKLPDGLEDEVAAEDPSQPKMHLSDLI